MSGDGYRILEDYGRVAAIETEPRRQLICVNSVYYDIPLPYVLLVCAPHMNPYCFFAGEPINAKTSMCLPYLYNVYPDGSTCNMNGMDKDPLELANDFWNWGFRSHLYYFDKRFLPPELDRLGIYEPIGMPRINYNKLETLSVDTVLSWKWAHGRPYQSLECIHHLEYISRMKARIANAV